VKCRDTTRLSTLSLTELRYSGWWECRDS